MTQLPEGPQLLTLFSIYAEQDITLYEEFRKFLRPYERAGSIHFLKESASHAQLIPGKGRPFPPYLKTADIILIFISPDLLASDYHCLMIEWVRKERNTKTSVIPILLRPSPRQNMDVLSDLLIFPRDGQAITSWKNRDEAFTQVAEEIARLFPSSETKSFAPLSSLLAQAEVERAEEHERHERYVEALACYNRILQFLPESACGPYFLKKGWLLYRLERYALALDICARSLSLSSAAEAYVLKASIFCRLKRYQEGLEACEQALFLDSTLARAYDTKSWTLYRLDDFLGALEASKQALEYDSTLASAYNNQGRALNQLKLYHEAIDAYAQAISCYQEALQDLPDARHLRHKIAMIYDNQGIAYHNMQNDQQALSSYKTALSLHEQMQKSDDLDCAVIYSHRGEIYLGLRRLDEAQYDFKKSIEISHIARTNLEREGRKGSQEYKQLLRDLANGYIILGRTYNAYHKSSYYELAKKACQDSLVLYEENSLAYKVLAEAYNNLNRKADAHEAYERARILRQQGK